MSRTDILWRPTWNEGTAPEPFSAFDGSRAVGRIYPTVTQVSGNEWLWFAADAHATGRCSSRLEAMMQLGLGILPTGTSWGVSEPAGVHRESRESRQALSPCSERARDTN